MKTQIIIEKPSEITEKITSDKENEQKIEKAVFLSLLNKGLITHAQYEECVKRI